MTEAFYHVDSDPQYFWAILSNGNVYYLDDDRDFKLSHWPDFEPVGKKISFNKLPTNIQEKVIKNGGQQTKDQPVQKSLFE